MVSQVVGPFDGEPTKFRNWIKSVEKYVLLAALQIICGYNCKIEYIEGKKNVCAYMLSCLPDRPSDSNDDNEPSSLDIIDKTFEVGMINGGNINLIL